MKVMDKSIILLILLVGIVLRSYNYFDIPFTNDEFSALDRLAFDSFSELIEKGVKIDGHPAGIQVFLYYWTALFGSQEWIVKLPFTLMGIASIYLVYLIVKKWFNETVGLLSSAYIASIQFTVMYSQIARPYISGLFFCLLLIYFWSNLIISPQRGEYRNSLFFILSATLCAYNHHFSLLFAGIVGLSGIFLIERSFLVKYILLGVLVFVLYIPHLDIFFYQLNMGGVEGWLAKPKNDFLLDFIHYIFHFSNAMLIVALALFFVGCTFLRAKNPPIKFIALAFVWFMLPFLIGFYYSKYGNAVLQYSVLIFSFPMLFFALFGWIKEQSYKVNLLLVSIILISSVYTLIYNRNHYTLFYNSAHERMLIDYQEVTDTSENTSFIIHSPEHIIRYYSSKLELDTSFTSYLDEFPEIIDLKLFLEEECKTKDQLFLGCLSSLPPKAIPLIQDYFPTIAVQKNYVLGTSYLFSKVNERTSENSIVLNFDNLKMEHWSNIDSLQVLFRDSSFTNRCYQLNANQEWGPSFSVSLSEIMQHKNNLIDISVAAKSDHSLDGIMIVAALACEGENIYWSGTDFNEYMSSKLNTAEWNNFHHTLKLSDIDLDFNSIQLKIYVWNKEKKKVLIDDFKISLRKGNQYVYGLNHKVLD